MLYDQNDENDETTIGQIQHILDGLGGVQGVISAVLVPFTGDPIVARTRPLPQETLNAILPLVLQLRETSTQLCVQFGLNEVMDFLHLQTPRGLGLLLPVEPQITLILITAPEVKLGLMHYLVTSTRKKLRNVPGWETLDQKPTPGKQLDAFFKT